MDPLTPVTAPPPLSEAAVAEASAAQEATESQPHLPLHQHVIESVQTVLTAMILAFVFRAFFIEPFIIPTGSMAEGLCGAHRDYVCPACGWEYAVGDVPSGGPPTEPPTCPNCHRRADPEKEAGIPKAGDRILVHKWPFELSSWLGPHRWDVIVFRDPANPEENYIKRLVGLPGESVEIVDGDVYINGEIARKPAAAQNALWFVVYDQNHARSTLADDAPTPWIAADESPPSLGWSDLDERVVKYHGPDDAPRSIRFDPIHSRYYLRDVYGYNVNAPDTLVGDVRLSAEIHWDSGEGELAWELVRGDDVFTLRLAADGAVTVTRIAGGDDHPSPRFSLVGRLPYSLQGRTTAVRFAHVDYRVWVEIDGQILLSTTPGQYEPDLQALRHMTRSAPVGLRVTARKFDGELRDLRIDRDVHYTRTSVSSQRAAAGEPFQLGPDSFFVLGDNSPNSHDGREWYKLDTHLMAEEAAGRYQRGTVRRDQIVGQAFFVYLPGLMPSEAASGLHIPDLGRLRFIR